ncbi:MAG: hypothetical protein ACOH17_02125 [Cellulomonas sp.]
MTRLLRTGFGVIAAALVVLGAAGVLHLQSTSRASYTDDGPGVTRLLDHLVSALNAREEAPIADLVAGEARLRLGPASGEATDAAHTWLAQYGGRDLDDTAFAWRRDRDGMLADARIEAVAADGQDVSIWLTVTGSPIDDEHQNDLVARISAPGTDSRIGAAPFSALPTTDTVQPGLRSWVVILGRTGVGLVVAGLVLVGLATRARARSRTIAQRGVTPPS